MRFFPNVVKYLPDCTEVQSRLAQAVTFLIGVRYNLLGISVRTRDILTDVLRVLPQSFQTGLMLQLRAGTLQFLIKSSQNSGAGTARSAQPRAG
jgi:hypothetical protein